MCSPTWAFVFLSTNPSTQAHSCVSETETETALGLPKLSGCVEQKKVCGRRLGCAVRRAMAPSRTYRSNISLAPTWTCLLWAPKVFLGGLDDRPGRSPFKTPNFGFLSFRVLPAETAHHHPSSSATWWLHVPSCSTQDGRGTRAMCSSATHCFLLQEK